MPDIRTPSGKILSTESLPSSIEPCFCAECGERLGWYDTGFGDAPIAWCDDCAADLED